MLEIYGFSTTHRVTFPALSDWNPSSPWMRHADAFSWQVLPLK